MMIAHLLNRKMLVLGFALISSVIPALSQNRGFKITVEQDKVYAEKVFGANQEVEIKGTLTKNLTAFRSKVLITGSVQANLNAIGGSVTIGPRAKVTGNVISLGGKLVIEEGAQISGQVIHLLKPDRHRQAWLDTTQSQAAYYCGQTLFIFLLVILIFYAFPNQINDASFELTHDLTRTLVYGALTIAAFFFCLFFSFLLFPVLIGLPLFLLFFCGFMVIAFYGAVVIFYRFGQFIESISNDAVPLTLAILIAIIIIGFLIHVPLIGPSIILGFLLFGVGIVIETRFGTNKQWFTKRSPYWSAG